MDDLIAIISFVLWVPFCGIVIAVTVALMLSLADFLLEILSRLKWRLIDFVDRKFSRGD